MNIVAPFYSASPLPQKNPAGPALGGLWAWHDAADAATITTESGGRVVQWSDKSGNGRHATVASGSAARPYNGTRTLNGRNAIELRGGQYLLLPDGQGFSAGDNTLLMVYRSDLGSYSRIFAGQTSDFVPGMYALFLTVNASSAIAVSHNENADYLYSPNPADTVSHIGGWRRSGSDIGIVLDGEIVISDSIAEDVATVGSIKYGAVYHGTVGWTAHFDGVLAEVLIYNRALSSGEMAQSSVYLKDKWGVT